MARISSGRAVGDDLAEVQHADPIGEVEHHVHVVLDEEDRQPALARDPPDDVDGRRGVFRRQALRRLVEQQKGGLLRHRHRDLEQTLIAVRQRGRRLVRPVEQAQLAEARTRSLLARLHHRAPAHEAKVPRGLELDRDAHVLQHGELGEDARDLKRPRDPAAAARGRGERGDVGALEDHAPRRRREQAGDQVEERGLARAVRPDERAELAGVHDQADVAHRPQRAEGAAEPVRLQHGRHARDPSRRAAPTSPPGRKITISTKMTPVKIIQCSV